MAPCLADLAGFRSLSCGGKHCCCRLVAVCIVQTSLSRQETLLDSFTSLFTSIRLLSLKGSPKVEFLTKKEPSYIHLAQVKYIFPEAIEITKALKVNEQTGSMIPELCVSLNVDYVALEFILEESSLTWHEEKSLEIDWQIYLQITLRSSCEESASSFLYYPKGVKWSPQL